jgi:endonuclease G
MKKVFSLLLLYIPVLTFAHRSYEPEAKGELIRHTYFSLDYNEEHEQPNWVYYMLTYELVKGDAKRKDNFRADKKVSTGSATPTDYKACGYDRGHLCPAADMKISEEAMSETFFMSNMSPQVPSFNRGGWSTLEDQIRRYVKDITDTLYIVTGPVFIHNKGKIGKNGVTIPGFYYKAVFCPKRGGTGFLIPNNKTTEDLPSWIVSIDLLEAMTGIDFFYQLEDKYEDSIESQVVWWDVSTPKRPINVSEDIPDVKQIEISGKDPGKTEKVNQQENQKNCDKIDWEDYEKIRNQFNILLIISGITISLLVIIIILMLLKKRTK